MGQRETVWVELLSDELVSFRHLIEFGMVTLVQFTGKGKRLSHPTLPSSLRGGRAEERETGYCTRGGDCLLLLEQTTRRC